MDEGKPGGGRPPRILPSLDDHNRAYWTDGAEGRLSILFCAACDRWVHPPAAECPAGHGELKPRTASGKGTVFAFTVNRHAFHPAVPVPYVVAIIELAEQKDLRLIANVVGCDVEDLSIGMPVEVRFEQHEEMFVPVFEPC